MRDHGQVRRLALLFAVTAIGLSGCALLRGGAESGPPASDPLPSPADEPAASAPPGSSSELLDDPKPPSESPRTPSATPTLPPVDLSSPAPPSREPADPNDPEVLTGSLGFDSAEGGCPYLETADGTRYQVIYPAGWKIHPTTGHLLGPDGTDARLGSTVSIRGSMATDMASTCQIGPMFRATEVIGVGG
jgi:hypothetical protein